MANTYLDIHVIQTVPPSNLNRDDTGSPKTAIYGGVQRARVSSQAWKRATRQEFKDTLDATDLGVRTRRAVEYLTETIRHRDPVVPPDAATLWATSAFEALGIGLEKKVAKGKDSDSDQQNATTLTKYLVFFSHRQYDRLAELMIRTSGKVTKKEAQAAADAEHGIDVALFGRMVADSADLNVDAAVQVAHALSTHAVAVEQDYFTAVDDTNPESETGAGMIGTVEFDSATFYRYATVNLGGLVDNLGDEAAAERALGAFLHAFVLSMPTGKQNTFANRTVPDAVVVMVREGQPVNLVGAFEEAVVGHGDGWVAASCEALATYAASVDSTFGTAPKATYVSCVGSRSDALRALGEEVSFADMVRKVAPVARLSESAG